MEITYYSSIGQRLWSSLGIAGFALIVFVTTAVGSQAAEKQAEGQKVLRLKDVIQEALDQNPDLRAVKYDALSKEAQIGPKGSYDNPMVALEAMNYPVDTLSPREFGMTGNQVSLSQKIPFPGKLTKLRNAARFEYEAQRAMFENKQLLLIKDVKTAYYGLFLAYKKAEILKEQQNIIKQLIVTTRNQYALGKADQSVVLALQTDEAELIDQALMVEKQIHLKMGELNHLLGKKEHPDFLQGKPEAPKKTQFDFIKNTEHLIALKIMSKNPSLKAAQHGVSSADEKVFYANWNYLPDFDFKVGYTMRQSVPGDRGVDFVSGMVGVSLPLWAFSKQSEEVKGAKADRAAADARLDAERADLMHRIHTAYAELEEAYKRVQLYDGGVLPLVRQSVTVAKSAFLARKMEYASLLALLDKRFRVEYSYSESLANYEIRISELEALLGEPLWSQ